MYKKDLIFSGKVSGCGRGSGIFMCFISGETPACDVHNFCH